MALLKIIKGQGSERRQTCIYCLTEMTGLLSNDYRTAPTKSPEHR